VILRGCWFRHCVVLASIELTKYLGIDIKNINPTYEDPIYWALEEGKLPVNLDALAVNLKDSIQRHTLAKLLEKGLNNPSDFVLPVKWIYTTKNWVSCVWEFRRGQCYLIPGNSPIGLRLPLESLPEVSKSKREQPVSRSLCEELPTLGDYYQ